MPVRLTTSSKVRVIGVKDGSCAIRVEANEAGSRRDEGNLCNISKGSILDGGERVVSGHKHGHLVIGSGSSEILDSFGRGISWSIAISGSLSFGWRNRHSDILREVRD